LNYRKEGKKGRSNSEAAEFDVLPNCGDSSDSEYEPDEHDPTVLKEKEKPEKPDLVTDETFILDGNDRPIIHAPCENVPPTSWFNGGMVTSNLLYYA